jgi:para-nitrobenzyl esterase
MDTSLPNEAWPEGSGGSADLPPDGVRRRTLMLSAGSMALAACAPMPVRSDGEPVVKTLSGRLKGEQRGNVHRFLGVPYAQAIGGDKRFAPPRPVPAWQGTRDARHHANLSPQQAAEMNTPVTPAFAPPQGVVRGDDCLALNIWAPAHGARDLPVMVWLHGGGWTSGSGSCAIYDGERLAGRGDVIVVTINHRLGASGLTDFSRVLGDEFADSANLGIRDIVAALTWVRDHIGAFGGNPGCVTIFGESGGGWKVNTLLATPAARGLFHRAVVESGPLVRFMTQDHADEVARAMLSALGITRSTAARLHALTWEQVVAAEAKVLAATPMSLQAPGFPAGFWPVLDNTWLPGHPDDPAIAALNRDVPLLIGQTGTEFTLFMLQDQAAYALDPVQLAPRVAHAFGAQAAPAILASYQRDFPELSPSGLWFRIFSDYAMGALNTAILDARRQAGAQATYAYRFDWNTPILDGKLHSPHTIEIPFVFDNATTPAGTIMTGGGAEAAALAKTVSQAWVQFAKTGMPAAPGLPTWPVSGTDIRTAMHLDTASHVGPYMDPEMARLFRARLWQAAGLS